MLCLPLFAAWAQYFAIVSDSHVGARDSVYSTIIKRLEAEDVKTIFHTGDAINTGGSLRQWKNFFEITGSKKALHLAAGNHDIDSTKSLRIYSQFFSDLYYSFPEGDTLFIILNTELPQESGRISGDQLSWLAKELDRSFRYKFIFLHEPLYPIVRLHGLDVHEKARDDLHRLFVKKRVSLVVAGHDHAYRRSVKDGVVYVISPRSRLFSGLFMNDGEPGYIVAKRKDRGYSFTVKDSLSGVRDTFDIIR